MKISWPALKLINLFLLALTLGFVLGAAPSLAQEPELTLPFDPGLAFRCTQGPGGTYSHSGTRTKYALDLAAPDGTRVLAAAGGVAHIFYDQPDPTFKPEDCKTATSKGFGNYVTIDHGNSYFTIYAHFRDFAPDIDGQPVVRGQYLGRSDNTGWSCGAHLHFGLHKGDATKVGLSTSTPATRIRTTNGNQAGVSTLAATDFKCGPEGTGIVYGAPSTGSSPLLSYISLSNGDPKVPADGIFVPSINNVFTLQASVPLGGARNLYITEFPPAGTIPTNLAVTYEAPHGPLSGGLPLCGASSALLVKGSVTVNGVKGFWGVISANDIAGYVSFIRSNIPNCDIVASDLVLTNIYAAVGTAVFLKRIDAASISTSAPTQ